MNTSSMPFVSSKTMVAFDSSHQMGMWSEYIRADSSSNTGTSAIIESSPKVDNRSDALSHQSLAMERSDQEANKPNDKVLRRLAQNREAARKSRLRKKAYVQQLESSRVKLAQLEQELERARQQGVFVSGGSGDGHLGLASKVNSGVTTFEMEYGHWVEEQNRQTYELRNALQARVSDVELRMLVDNGLGHYDELFRMKASAAKSDVFYVMSGMWRTTAERFFLWVAGFRPSEILKVLTPQLEPLTEQQMVLVCGLQQTSQEAEDALSQGLENLQQTLAESLTSSSMGQSGTAEYMSQMATAVGKLEALVGFVTQADHVRRQALQQMYRILTTRQAARGLLALGDYFQRLRALSSLWAARPREPA